MADAFSPGAVRGDVSVTSAGPPPALPGWTASWTAVADARLRVRFLVGRRALLARVEATDLAMHRAPTRGSVSGEPLVAVLFVQSGTVRLSRDRGPVVRAEAGTAVAVRFERLRDVVAGSGCVLSLFLLPAAALAARGADVHDTDVVTWTAGRLEALAVQLAESGLDLDAGDAAALEPAMTELVAPMIAREQVGEDPAARARARAVALIGDRYTDPELDADAVARMLGVSRRYLYSLFEGRDLSVAALIRHRRVAHAQAVLTQQAELPLRQVAQLSGLSTEDRLLRTFKTVLGTSPSAYRRTAGGPAPARDFAL